MSRFHTYVKNESSSDSEDGELNDSNEELIGNEEPIESNEQMFDSNALKASKSLQILDKRDNKSQNRFSIWSDILLEEELNQSVSNSLDIKKRRRNTTKLNRNSENYSFWTKKQFEDNLDKPLTQNQINSDINTKTKRKKKKNKKKKTEKTIDFALEMAKKLNEPKVELLRRVCETIGEEKTSELCSATLDIESAGGLLTADGRRRRTSGGVFFHLLKNDANISKEKIDFIFLNELKVFRNNKKFKKREKRRHLNKSNQKPNKSLNGIESKSQSNGLESMAIEPQESGFNYTQALPQFIDSTN